MGIDIDSSQLYIICIVRNIHCAVHIAYFNLPRSIKLLSPSQWYCFITKQKEIIDENSIKKMNMKHRKLCSTEEHIKEVSFETLQVCGNMSYTRANMKQPKTQHKNWRKQKKKNKKKKNSSVEKQKHHITFHRSCSVAFSGVLEWAHCGGVIENEPKQLKRIRQCVCLCMRRGGMMMMISGGSTAVLRCRCLYLHTIKREWGLVYIRWRWM